MARGMTGGHQTGEGGIDHGRRSVLTASGVGLAMIAGVPVGSAIKQDVEFTEEEILTLFELVIEDEGVDVAELEVEEDDMLASQILSLEYYPIGTTEEEIMVEMGYITGVFAEAIDMGLEVAQLSATVLNIMGEPVTEWYIETEWAEAYNAGEMTGNEVAMEALMTLEPVEE